MYVCLCNALTEANVAQAVTGGATRPHDVYEACGARAECGTCAKTILCVLRRLAQGADAGTPALSGI